MQRPRVSSARAPCTGWGLVSPRKGKGCAGPEPSVTLPLRTQTSVSVQGTWSVPRPLGQNPEGTGRSWSLTHRCSSWRLPGPVPHPPRPAGLSLLWAGGSSVASRVYPILRQLPLRTAFQDHSCHIWSSTYGTHPAFLWCPLFLWHHHVTMASSDWVDGLANTQTGWVEEPGVWILLGWAGHAWPKAVCSHR